MTNRSDQVILAVDYGLSRVGLAFSRGGFVSSLPIVPCDASLITTILKFTEEEGVQTILVGLPEEPQRSVVELFIKTLEGKFSGKVLAWDEVSTTQVAEEVLKKTKAGKSRPVDSAAAALILNEYLDQF